MADNEPWNSGSDAAYIKPKFVPDEGLHGPDPASGGPGPVGKHHAQFGDAGRVTEPKGYLGTGKKD
jgi:hypothetical protein